MDIVCWAVLILLVGFLGVFLMTAGDLRPCQSCGHPRAWHHRYSGCRNCDCPGWTEQEEP